MTPLLVVVMFRLTSLTINLHTLLTRLPLQNTSFIEPTSQSVSDRVSNRETHCNYSRSSGDPESKEGTFDPCNTYRISDKLLIYSSVHINKSCIVSKSFVIKEGKGKRREILRYL